MAESLRERRRQMLRNEILTAAQALMTQKGYASFLMDELAACVGISKPTLYSYFSTKDDVIVAAMSQKVQSITDLFLADIGSQSPLERLVSLLEQLITFQIEDDVGALRPFGPEIFKLLSSHEEVIQIFRRLDMAVYNLVERAIAQGEVRTDLEPRTIMRAYYALIAAFRLPSFNCDVHLEAIDLPQSLAQIFKCGVGRQSS